MFLCQIWDWERIPKNGEIPLTHQQHRQHLSLAWEHVCDKVNPAQRSMGLEINIINGIIPIFLKWKIASKHNRSQDKEFHHYFIPLGVSVLILSFRHLERHLLFGGSSFLLLVLWWSIHRHLQSNRVRSWQRTNNDLRNLFKKNAKRNNTRACAQTHDDTYTKYDWFEFFNFKESHWTFRCTRNS